MDNGDTRTVETAAPGGASAAVHNPRMMRRAFVCILAVVLALCAAGAAAFAAGDGLTDADYEFTITGAENANVSIQQQFDMLDGVALDIKDNDGQDVEDSVKAAYELYIASVTRTYNGALDDTFTWDGKSTFTAPGESGYTYTLTYGVRHVAGGAAALDAEGNPVAAVRYVDVITKTVTKGSLDTDDEFIGSVDVSRVETGTAPWDSVSDAEKTATAAGGAKYSPGDDESSVDDIVRTNDTVNYTLAVNTAAYTHGVSYANGYVWFKFVLPYEDAEARIDTGSMGWISVENGYESFATTEQIDVDGDGSPEDCQVLYAARQLRPQEGQASAFPVGNMEVNLAVKVRTMKNGDVVTPLAYAWLDHNNSANEQDGKTLDGNPRDWSEAQRTSLDENVICETHKDNRQSGGKEVQKFSFDPVTVSAAPGYDLILSGATTDNNVLDWDFSSGNDTAQNKERGTVNGAGDRYSFTLLLQGENAGKGLKGIEVPEGDITFDLNFSQTYEYTDPDDGTKKTVDITDEYNALVWNLKSSCSAEYYNNVLPGTGRALAGKESYVQSTGTVFASPVFRGNGKGSTSGSNYNDTAYNGGEWSGVQDGNTVHVTVKDYEVDMDWFPSINIWGSVSSPTYYGPNNATGLANTYRGVISGGDIEVVHPFYNEAKEYLAEKYGAGTIRFSVKDVNLRATSISGQVQEDAAGSNSAQRAKGNDTVNRNIVLTKTGSYQSVVHYTTTNANLWADINNVGSGYPGMTCYGNSQDVAQNGQPGSIQWGYMATNYGFESNGLVGLNSLMKFDPDMVKLDGNPQADNTYRILDRGTLKWNFLYAAKADGDNWTSMDEMNSTLEDDLVYYGSLSDLEAAGKTCVGILMEARAENTSDMGANRGIFGKVRIKLVDDSSVTSSIAGVNEHVAPVVVSTTAWRQGDGDDKLVGSVIPTRSATDGYAKPDALANAEKTSALVKYRVANNLHQNYTPAKYDESGTFTGGGTPGSWDWGDSVYITPYKAVVEKVVAQRASSSSPSAKSNFDLDNEQTVIDYAVTVRTSTYADTSASGYAAKTTLSATDILPDGLSYIEGSSYLGGTYVQSDPVGDAGTVEGGTKLDDPTAGTLSAYINENVIYPSTYPSMSGSQRNAVKDYDTLTWTIDDAEVGKSYTIHFSAKIDKLEALNNQSYVNRAYVQSAAIEPAFYTTRPEVKSYALCTAKVTKNASVSLLTNADYYYNDAGDEMGFNLYWQNTSQNDTKSGLMMDTLPASGSGHSNFVGDNALKSLEITLPSSDAVVIEDGGAYYRAGSKNVQYRVFYTDDPQASTETSANYQVMWGDAEDGDLDSAKKQFTYASGLWALPAGWTELATTATTKENGDKVLVCEIPAFAAEHATAWAAVGTIPGGETVKAEVGIVSSTDAEIGNAYENCISYGNGRSNATCYIADRKLSGTTWFDSDKDGRRDGNEKGIAGITASLYKAKAVAVDASTGAVYAADENGEKTGEPLSVYKNIPGAECTTKTDANGRYSFEHLEHGDYTVVFTGMDSFKDGEGNNLYFLTEQHASAAGSDRDSDAQVVRSASNYTVLAAAIPAVSMPATNAVDSEGNAIVTSSPYQVSNLNAGFTTSDPAAVNVSLRVAKQLLDAGANGSAISDRSQMEDISDTVKAGQFSFKIEAGDDATAAAIADGAVRLPEGATIDTMTAQTEAGAAEGATAAFEDLTFDKEGTYSFKISENAVDDTSYTADAGYVMAQVQLNKVDNPSSDEAEKQANPYVLKPTVTYAYLDSAETEDASRISGGSVDVTDAEGNAVNGGKANGTAHFQNVYTAPRPVSVAFKAKKELAGWTLAEGQFRFSIGEAVGSKAQGVTIIAGDQVNDANGVVSLASATFSEEGQYDFVATELDDGAAGYTYDATPAQIHVVVTKSDDPNPNELVATVSCLRGSDKYSETNAERFQPYTDDAIVFSNSYAAAPASDTLTASKTITSTSGRAYAPEDGEFSFTLEPTSVPAGVDAVQPQTKANDADGNITFDELTFPVPGTYTYTVTENDVESERTGTLAKDGSTFTVTYEVSDNGSGQLQVARSIQKTADGQAAPVDAIAFDNSYAPVPANDNVSASVQVTGGNFRLMPGNFKVALVGGKAGEATAAQDKAVATDGSVVFDALEFSEAGTYTYVISQDALDAGNLTAQQRAAITRDESVYTLTYLVTDDGSGQLACEKSLEKKASPDAAETTELSPDDPIVFKNTYAVQPLNVNVAGTKTVTPADGNSYGLAGGEFGFMLADASAMWNRFGTSIYPVRASALEPNASTAFNAAGGSFSFGDAQDGSITFRDSGYFVFMVSEMDLDKGHLTEQQRAAFSKDENLYFLGYLVTDLGTGRLTVTRSTILKTSDLFDRAKYQQVQAVSFDNGYDPATSASIAGEVSIGNEDAGTSRVPGEGEFNFSLAAVDGAPMPEGAEEVDGVSMKTVANAAADEQTGKAAFDFGTVEYQKPGTYRYTMKQVAGSDTTLGYDDASCDVTVTVTEKGGYLEASVVYGDQGRTASFVNTYRPTTVEMAAPATAKTLTGRELAAGEFEFTLDGLDGAPMPAGAGDSLLTVGNEADGTVDFGTIAFAGTGTYKYTIAEVQGDLPGITYDDAAYTATATVAEDAARHAYTASWSIADAEGNVVQIAQFENAYTAVTESPLGVDATKTLIDQHADAQDAPETPVANADDDGGEAPEGTDAAGDGESGQSAEGASGSAADEPAAEGEQDGEGTGSSSTSAESAASDAADGEGAGAGSGDASDIVPVAPAAEAVDGAGELAADDGDAASASAEGEAAANGESGHQMAKAPKAPGAANDEPAAGDSLAMDAGDFSFAVYVAGDAAENGDNAHAVLTGANEACAAGSSAAVDFADGLSYTTEYHADDYTSLPWLAEQGWTTRVLSDDGASASYTINYVVCEDATNLPTSVTAKTQNLAFQVTVTDNLAGSLVSQADYGQGADGLAFENVYGSATLDFNGVTTVTGNHVLGDGEFGFEISGVDAGGNALPATLLPAQTTARNDAAGAVGFGNLVYDEGNTGLAAGESATYTYTVTEQPTDVPGIQIAEPATFKVTVSRDADGNFGAAVSAGDQAMFTMVNAYVATPASVQVIAQKELAGATLQDGQFGFELVDADGKAVSSARNAADGSISFDALEFAEPGTYLYTVAEQNDGQEGITYDGSRIAVAVTVADDGLGALHASVDGDTPHFRNVFTPEEEPGDGDHGGNAGTHAAGDASDDGSTTPGGSSPTTGDNSLQLGVLALVTAIAAAGVGFFALKRRERAASAATSGKHAKTRR